MTTRGILLAATLVLPLLGLAGCPDRPARPRDSLQEPHDMTRLRDLGRHPTLSITIQQGTEHFDDGLITLTVRGDGAATVDQRRSGTTRSFPKQLPPDRVTAVGASLADHQLTRARTSKMPRTPGDTPLVLRLDGDADAPFRADLWYADRYKDPDLNAIVELADALIHEISGGALGQPAPSPRPTP